MAIPAKIKKFFGKCKKPFTTLSKFTKKSKKESIVPSSIISTISTTSTINATEKEVVIPTEIKVNTVQETLEVPLSERQHQLHAKPRQQHQQHQHQHQHQHQQQHHQQHYNHSTTRNNYKRYSINSIFNKSKLTPSFIHPVAIKLNVGGIEYTTTQQTLCTYPSYLSELFFLFRSPNSPPSPPSSTCSQYPWPGEIFIDRDGELFVHVLSFLRNGTLPYTISLSTLQKLEYEAKFYGIKPLQNLISHRVHIHTSSPKFKVVPIEKLNNEEYDYNFGNEIAAAAAAAAAAVAVAAGIGMKRSESSSSSSLPQRKRIDSDNISLNSSSSYGNSSEEVPIIYNPCGTTRINYMTPNTRTPKSSTSTASTSTTFQDNSHLSDYKPEYEIISITKVPIILNYDDNNFDNSNQMSYLQEKLTYVVLQRKDD